MRLEHTPSWAALVGLALLFGAGPARASDHADTTVLESEASVDIADVFAWTGAESVDDVEARFVYLAMTLRGRPAPGVQYVFHLDGKQTFTGATTHRGYALCRFDLSLGVECWLGEAAYAVGDASAGLLGYDLAAWTGFVDDPAFADLVGLSAFADGLALARTSTRAGACPDLSVETRDGLLSSLKTSTMNDFAGERVFLLLLRAPVDVALPSGRLLGVWASARGATP